MIEREWLGEKTGQGFYKRVGKEKEIHAIDLKTLEYHPALEGQIPLRRCRPRHRRPGRASASRW